MSITSRTKDCRFIVEKTARRASSWSTNGLYDESVRKTAREEIERRRPSSAPRVRKNHVHARRVRRVVQKKLFSTTRRLILLRHDRFHLTGLLKLRYVAPSCSKKSTSI